MNPIAVRDLWPTDEPWNYGAKRNKPRRRETGAFKLAALRLSRSNNDLPTLNAVGLENFRPRGFTMTGRPLSSRIDRAYSFARLSAYSFRERMLIRAADLAFFVLIKLIGRTVKFRVEGWENWEAASQDGRLPIYTFWHNRVFLATYFWRSRRIVVMTSQSFDGEYIARFIQRFGYGAARGSSTRGATGAVVEMVRLMRAGFPTAFTIDGPKGPRYLAKMGPVLLAKKTGNPILPFTITAEKFWEASKSWDGFQVPKPFTSARVDIAAPIYVRADANGDELNAKRDELQLALDQITRCGDDWRNLRSSR